VALGGLSSGTRAVLLDALGTLLTLAPPGPAFARVLAREHGLAVADAQAARAFAAEIAYYREHHHEGRDADSLADLRRRCAAVLRTQLPARAQRALSPQQLAAAMLDALHFTAYPDAPGTLAALRSRGLRLVVASNWDSSLPQVLAHAGLAGLLDGVVTSAEVGEPKPGGAIFAAALTLAGVTANEAVHVGDSPVCDVAGARGAGIAPLLLRRAGAAASAAGGAAASAAGKDASAATAPVATIRSLADLLT
jgi:putative hydrolase of the HAD superfamily